MGEKEWKCLSVSFVWLSKPLFLLTYRNWPIRGWCDKMASNIQKKKFPFWKLSYSVIFCRKGHGTTDEGQKKTRPLLNEQEKHLCWTRSSAETLWDTKQEAVQRHCETQNKKQCRDTVGHKTRNSAETLWDTKQEAVQRHSETQNKKQCRDTVGHKVRSSAGTLWDTKQVAVQRHCGCDVPPVTWFGKQFEEHGPPRDLCLEKLTTPLPPPKIWNVCNLLW